MTNMKDDRHGMFPNTVLPFDHKHTTTQYAVPHSDRCISGHKPVCKKTFIIFLETKDGQEKSQHE